MTDTDADLQRMLTEAYQHGSGPARFAALDTVLRHADALGRTAFAFRARMNALRDMNDSGEYARSFMTFSWLLHTFDRHPEVSTSHDAHRLLWCFKWIVWQLAQFSAVPLEQWTALLDDMQRRYQAGNHSLHAVYQHRLLVTTHLGELAAAAEWFDRLADARRDSLSDCRACVPTTQVEHLVARGDYDQAVLLGSPFTRGGCTEQPHQMISHLLLAYLRTGRYAEAVDGHRVAYPRIRDNRHCLDIIGLNVQFCGLTGNHLYAVPILERHLPWLDRPASPYAAMEFASAGALVLGRLIADGAGDTPIRRATDNGDRRWVSTAADTYAELAALARQLAADFDRRNANAYQSGRVEARMAAEPVVDSLPLTVLAGRPIAAHRAKRAVDELVRTVADRTVAGDAPGAARARLDAAYALRNADQWGDALETAEEARRSLDAAGLTDEALRARYLLIELYDRTDRHAAARLALVDELLSAPSLPDSLPPRVTLLEETVQVGDGLRAVQQLFAAAELHRAAGDSPAEVRTLSKGLAASRVPPDRFADIVARVDEIVTGPSLAGAQDDLCRLYELAGEPDAALARAERYASAGPRLILRAATLLHRLGRHVEAQDRATPLLDDRRYSWQATRLIAASLRARGEDLTAFLAERGLDEDDLEDDDFD